MSDQTMQEDRLEEFAALLKGQFVNTTKGITPTKQLDEGKILHVPKVDLGYKPLMCWYNCKYHADKNGGQVIFGWELSYREDLGVYEARHHAIWMSPAGEYQDITPSPEGLKPFLVDGRSSFDYQNYRHPANFYSSLGPVKKMSWGAQHNDDNFEAHPSFFICKREPDDETSRLLSLCRNT